MQPQSIFIAKIRNGFVPRLREEVAKRFKGLEMDVCPFADLSRAEISAARQGADCRKYGRNPMVEAEDHLRHSRFVALRDDVDPREVRKEMPAAA